MTKVIQIENDIEVELEIEILIENSGIGGYEFWGYRGYDEGNDYFIIEDVKWDKSSYSQEQNEMIERIVNSENFEDETIKEAEYLHKNRY